MPMPSTIKLMASISALISVRMPTSFRPCQRMSLGHLIPQLRPLISRIASTVATAAINVHLGASCGGKGGLRMTDTQTPPPGGENHPRFKRPRPKVCASDTTIVPSTTSSAAKRLASLLVEDVSKKCTICLPKNCVDNPALISSGSNRSGRLFQAIPFARMRLNFIAVIFQFLNVFPHGSTRDRQLPTNLFP